MPISDFAAETLRGMRARGWSAFLALSVLASAFVVPSSRIAAQQKHASKSAGEDSRWYPWIGCWERSGDGASASASSSALTCVRPGTGTSADIVTIANGTVESRERLVVDGLPHAIDKDGCHGSQTASWSESGNRIYIGAAYSCSDNLHGRSTRMFSILPSGVWLEVRDVHAGGGWVETVTRFHDAGLPASVPADIRSEISHRELAVATARAAASAPVTANDIAEATRSVDTVVVQSWLAARGQAFAAESPGTAAPSGAQVYATAPSQPAPPPVTRDYDVMEPGCDAFGCYERNVYSSYNGYAYSPFLRSYVYGFGPSYYVPFAAPLVVIRGGGRGPVRGHQVGVRPPIIHTPGGARPPVGHTPIGHTPIGTTAVGHTPSEKTPRGGMPGRIRP